MHGPCAGTTPSEIEPKWQRVWEEEGLYRASDDPDDPRPRFYALDMFPYPSGDLHMGHAEAFSGGDAVARFRALQGYNVLHPIGWDAFGLNAENAAIKRHIHPEGMDVREHRSAGGVVQADGHVVRLVAHGADVRPRVLPVDAVAVPALLRARAGLPEERAGQLVPPRPDGAGERAGDRRSVRAMRHDGGASRPDPVVLQDHRLRAAAAGRHGRRSRRGPSAC